MRHIEKIAIIGVITGIIVLLLGCSNTKMRIEDSRMLVKEIKNIKELVTVGQVREIVINDTLVNKVHERSFLPWNWNDTTDEKYCLVQIGTVIIKAGFNLEKVSEKDVKINGNTLCLKLPKAEILEVSMNPRGIEPYYEEKIEGDWDDEKMIQEKKKEMYGKFKEIAKQRSLDDGILDKATELGKESLYRMFIALGFTEVVIEIG